MIAAWAHKWTSLIWNHWAIELVSSWGKLSCRMPRAVRKYPGTQWSATCDDGPGCVPLALTYYHSLELRIEQSLLFWINSSLCSAGEQLGGSPILGKLMNGSRRKAAGILSASWSRKKHNQVVQHSWKFDTSNESVPIIFILPLHICASLISGLCTSFFLWTSTKISSLKISIGKIG